MGYAAGHIISTELIQPGKGLLFSVPVTHVGRSWYMQVPFQFHLPPIHGTQPLELCAVRFGGHTGKPAQQTTQVRMIYVSRPLHVLTLVNERYGDVSPTMG